MQDQKTSDDTPTVFYLTPAPLAPPFATRPPTKATVQQRAARESVKLPYVPPVQEVPRLDMKAIPERMRGQFEQIQPVAPRENNPPAFDAPDLGGVAAAIGIFFTASFVFALAASIFSTIFVGFFGYIGVKLAVKLVGPLPIRDNTPRPPTETITMQRIGPPPSSNVLDV